MSRKVVAFSVPAPAAKPPARRGSRAVARDSSDAWVSRSEPASPEPARAEPLRAEPRAPGLLIDLAAPRSLFEVVALSVLAPVALGWFWFAHAIAATLGGRGLSAEN